MGWCQDLLEASGALAMCRMCGEGYVWVMKGVWRVGDGVDLFDDARGGCRNGGVSCIISNLSVGMLLPRSCTLLTNQTHQPKNTQSTTVLPTLQNALRVTRPNKISTVLSLTQRIVFVKAADVFILFSELRDDRDTAEAQRSCQRVVVVGKQEGRGCCWLMNQGLGEIGEEA